MDAIVPLRWCDRTAKGSPSAVLALLALTWLGCAASLDTAAAGSGAEQGGSAEATDSPRSPVDDSLFASPTTRDHIGRVVVPVSINGRGPYRFIVDTGANHSTISPGLVRELGLTAAAESLITLNGITGSAQVAYVSIDRLQAGDLVLQDTTLPVVWAPVMAGADGILGAAGMSQKSLLIDFQRNRVAIASHVDLATRNKAVKIHAARVVNGLMVLDTDVGGVRVAAVLDTGSERTLGNIALRNAVRAKQRARQGFAAMLTSVYGATKEAEPGEIAAAPTISIGSLRITDVAMVYGDFHIFSVWDLNDKPAMVLGMDVLGTVASLNIDFKNETVYVGNVPSANPRDVLGTPHDVSAMEALKK